jgi:ligand-binding sensor domain-containing protein
LARDNQGRVWSSSPIGKTVIFDPKDETTRLVTTDSGDDIHANAIRYDGANTMQLGSVYGLWTYDLRNGKCDVAFGNQKGTQQWMNQMVTDVKADRQQGMMLLTHPEGITIFDTKQDTLYYIRRTDDIIKGMTQDGNGVYWVCTTSGSVVAIQPKRQADGNIQLSTFNYLLSSGMPQFYFNGDAMVCSPKGEILMGGTEGYISI